MTSVVTGGAGFIGSWLCEALLQKGEKVICIDNLVTGSEKNIARFKENFVFINHDVTGEPEINEKIDYVYHLASPASPVDFKKLAKEIMLVNSIGTANMLKLAEKNNARFLFASTSEVYGDPKEHPQKESYFGNVNPTGPRACYDESKRFAEAWITSSGYENSRIVRIFNTYGPRMRPDDGRAVPNFITQCIKGEPVTVYGNGSQTRSFCYVDDLVRGIIKVMESIVKSPVNLGNPEEITILECAEMIKKITGSDSEIVFRPMPNDDPARRKPDITKALELGWEPETGLEQGLAKTIEYFRNF